MFFQKSRVLFCIDPGLKNIGWCACLEGKILDKGTIVTDKSDISLRIHSIVKALREKTNNYPNAKFFMEEINFIKPGREKASVGIIMVMGALMLEYRPILINPFTVRKSIMSSGRVDKDQIIDFVSNYFSEEIKDHNVADALLIAIYITKEFLR